MADVDLTVEVPDRDGLAATYNALNDTDVYFARADDLLLHFKNTGASPAVVTFDVTQTVGGVDFVDPTVTVPATSGDLFVGNLANVYQIASGTDLGKVKFTQDQASGVTVAVLKA